MADNVAYPLPDGTTTNVDIASDDVSGVQFQKVKLDLGGDGLSVPVVGTMPVSDAGGSLTVDGAVSVSNFPATQTVSAASLPLPTGAATSGLQTTGNTSLASIDGKLPALSGGAVPITGAVTTAPASGASGAVVRPITADNWQADVSRVAASTLDSPNLTLIRSIGSGQGVSQSTGTLVITSGTTANAQTMIRSTRTFTGASMLRYVWNMSQYIANQTLEVSLADLIGDGCAYTINSSTSVTVTFPAGHGFTSANVGQSLNLGALTSVGIPGRYAIASVSGDAVTFTVSGFPGSGTGTCTVWGWNYSRILHVGNTTGAGTCAAQRNGWSTGDSSTTWQANAINQILTTGQTAMFAIVQANSSNQTSDVTVRFTRTQHVPDDTRPMYVFIVMTNGSSAPASTTTYTLSQLYVESYQRQRFSLPNSEFFSGSNGLPVQILGLTSIALASAANRGYTSAVSAIHYDDTATPLTANATYNGAWRDLSAIAAGNRNDSITSYSNRNTCITESDVAGTLQYWGSPDNGTTAVLLSSTAATAVSGGGFVARGVEEAVMRYGRWTYVNGGTNQTRFRLHSALKG